LEREVPEATKEPRMKRNCADRILNVITNIFEGLESVANKKSYKSE
jgi:hypothetical protein